jgi:hypothetical protein
MFVVGGITMIAFFTWEWKFASFPLMPRRVMNRTMVSFVHSVSSIKLILDDSLDLLYHHRLYVLPVRKYRWKLLHLVGIRRQGLVRSQLRLLHANVSHGIYLSNVWLSG